MVARCCSLMLPAGGGREGVDTRPKSPRYSCMEVGLKPGVKRDIQPDPSWAAATRPSAPVEGRPHLPGSGKQGPQAP
eukprot:15464066-Alexandrium_andersonii.AAC.1